MKLVVLHSCGKSNTKPKSTLVFIYIYIYIVNTTSPDLAEFFVFGYSMIPKNSSHVYFSLDLFKEGIHSFYLETGSDPFNSVKLKLGKFAGFVGGIYYIDMGILFGNLLHTIYYNFCLSGGAPYTDRKSICLHCGTKGYIHLDGYCASEYIYLFM